LEEVAADCVLAIHVVHEAPDAQHFVRQAAALVKPGGHLLLLEPYFHVSKADFEETQRMALESGLRRVKTGGPLGSRSALLVRE
jgi:2-polyprenyl-3-methyl-5-hydroxy-6-metoxy-1,4-benzoquinol methylase